MELRGKAERLLQLHEPPPVLLLVNVWDVAGARLLEEAGHPALATTSAGIANSLGYPDGEQIPREEMLQAVARITAAVNVPVTADMEAGYGATPEAAAVTARGVLAAGAVGLNLEDAHQEHHLLDVAQQVERIQAVREVAAAATVPLVINARTDVFLAQVGDPAHRLHTAIDRGQRYRKAGADCIFVPGVADAATIATLVGEIGGPINILATHGTPAVAELSRLGVARISFGSAPMRAALGLLRQIALEAQNAGTYSRCLELAVSYAEANRLVAPSTDPNPE